MHTPTTPAEEQMGPPACYTLREDIVLVTLVKDLLW